MKRKQAKGYHSKQRAVALLEKCKLHSRPFVSVEEIESALKTMKDDKRMQILRYELYFVN